jgi:hypothetical protein
MSQSGAGKPDPDLEGVELLFHQKGGSASFGAKMVLSLNGVDPGCMNPITGSTCRAKCSNTLHDTDVKMFRRFVQLTTFDLDVAKLSVHRKVLEIHWTGGRDRQSESKWF